MTLVNPQHYSSKVPFLIRRLIIPKMQPSIKSFFKTKQPNVEQSGESRIEGNKDLSVKDEQKSEQLKTPAKRSAVRDEDGADETILTKRQAVQSDNETSLPVTPVRGGPKIPDAGEAKTLSTPSKPVPVCQSPLLSVEVLIRKKISSGAHALHENIGPTWFKVLQPEFDKPYFKKLSTFVQHQRQTKSVFPPPEQVYTWTHFHPIRDTRVVIIGQDPYHGPRQAHGLSFSVQKGVAIPKSLQNIYKELTSDIADFKPPLHGNLTGWSKQGVLLLNACLTVNQGEPNSHQGKGWESFTDAVISWISKNVNHNVVFILWGKFAQKKSSLIDKRHKILTSPHPSPFSADSGFFGCKHFSQTNNFLKAQRLPEINWSSLD